MSGNERHGRARYRRGCRCDLCKCAESEYQKGRRRRIAEAVGEFAGPAGAGLVLLRESETASTSANAPSDGVVASAVSAEIEAMGAHRRPGLAATALALARILDNPKAVSTQPAAAKVLATLLEKLHTASARGRRGKLALVRAMTEKGGEQPAQS